MILLQIAQILGLIHCIHEYGFDFCTTVGASMEPTLSARGDVLVFEKVSHRLNKAFYGGSDASSCRPSGSRSRQA